MGRISINVRSANLHKKLQRATTALVTKNYSNRPVTQAYQGTRAIKAFCESHIRDGLMEHTEMLAEKSLSVSILSMAGCSLVTDSSLNNRKYSLLHDQTDTELVDNPNKFDVKFFENLKSKKITINTIFKNTEDSIFQLDAELSIQQQLVNKKNQIKFRNPDCREVAFKLINLNYRTLNNMPLRAFKS